MLQSIQDVNQDIIINNYYLQSSPSPITYSYSLLDPQRLMNVLKKKNKQYERAADAKKIIVIPEPLRQLHEKAIKQMKLANFKYEKEIEKKQIGRELKSELLWQNFTLANQQDYVYKHEEYLLHKMISKSFKRNTNVEKTVKNLMMNNLKGLKDDIDYSPSRIKSTGRIEDDSEVNSSKYHEFIKRKVLENEEDMDYLEEFKHLRGEISHIWQIISEQIKSYNYAKRSNKRKPQLAIVNASITLIQNHFKYQLPSLTNEKEISEYMRKKYVSYSQNYNYQTNQDGLLVWAIPYAYYKAGAWQNFLASLNDRGKEGINLREYYSKFQESLIALEPVRQPLQSAFINDVFYNQLVDIVKGISLYDRYRQIQREKSTKIKSLYLALEEISKIGSLDLVWLSLKTLKIYDKKLQLDYVISEILKYFLPHKTQEKTRINTMMPIIQLLYLNAYEALIKYQKSSPKSAMTMDDYIHLLLVLESNQEMLDPQIYEIILQTLQHELISYISSLVRTIGVKEYTVFYILSIPKQIFKNVITVVFNNWQIFNSINMYMVQGSKGWKYIKFKYNFAGESQIFEDAVLQLFKNLIQYEKNNKTQLQIIKLANELLENAKDYLDLTILCQCKHLIKLKDEQQKIGNSKLKIEGNQNQVATYHQLNAIIISCLESNEDLEEQFGPIAKFLEDFCQLQDVKDQKQLNNLEKFIKNQQYLRDLQLLLTNEVSPINLIFEKLDQNNALKLFFIYIKDVIYSKQKISYFRGTYSNLENKKRMLAQTLRELKKKKVYEIDSYLDYLQASINLRIEK